MHVSTVIKLPATNMADRKGYAQLSKLMGPTSVTTTLPRATLNGKIGIPASSQIQKSLPSSSTKPT
jgi:hypothetical protein